MIGSVVSLGRMRPQSEGKLWLHMLGYSLMLHGALVLVALLWPGLSGGQRPLAPVYSVDLVTLPRAAGAGLNLPSSRSRQKGVEARPLTPIRRFRASRLGLSLQKMQRALSRAERQRESELPKKNRPRQQPAVHSRAAARKQVSLANIGGMKSGELSQALRLYRALLYEKIENNWILPQQPKRLHGKLEAVVVVRARRDGSLAEIKFEKKSGDPYFDDSVLKAILKSKPFPPFPDIYSPKEEEIVIHFSPANGRS